MQYVLGNMLNGAGGLNADGLALDLQFAADKTLTARKGPTPVFTRGSTGTFVGSNGLIQTAAVNDPRFDHTSAGVCRGLLIEESRTNQILHSQNFANAAWQAVGTGATKIGASSLADPQGLSNAYEINVGTTGGSNPSTVRQIMIPSLTTAQRTLSIYVRTASGTSVFRFQVWTGSIELNSGNFTATTTWTRFTFVINDAVSEFKITAGSAGGSVSNIHVWGAQLEVGAFETSYIPTTTGSVVRSADVCSITGLAFSNMWNASEGTMFASGNTIGNVFKFYFYLNAQGSPSTSNAFLTNFGASAAVIQKDTPAAFKSEATISSSIPKRMAYAYTSGATSSSSINGLIPTPSTNNATASVASASTLEIGGTSTTALSGWITSARYYRKRLSNAKLAQLTA